jgi:hypothetical protein
MFRKTQPLMLRLLLLAVYSAFFVVQINLYAGNVNAFKQQLRFNNTTAKQHAGKEKYLRATSSPDTEKINVLVNKKFHPENTPFIIYTFDILQPVFSSRAELSMLVTFPHILPVLADSLRAPPVTPFTV